MQFRRLSAITQESQHLKSTPDPDTFEKHCDAPPVSIAMLLLAKSMPSSWQIVRFWSANLGDYFLACRFAVVALRCHYKILQKPHCTVVGSQM